MKSLIRTLVPKSFLRSYHFGWALAGAIWYGFPARKITVIGVTGTDGKSTTTEMIVRVLKEQGLKVCSTSSVWFQMGDDKKKNTMKLSMPGRAFLQKFLRQAVRHGCTHAVLEVSSEGILQNRHRFLNFHTAVITNLSPEHIERHGGFENYKRTKAILFQCAKQVHVVNTDDEHAAYFRGFEAQKKWGYGMKASKAQFALSSGKQEDQNLKAENVQEERKGMRFEIEGQKFEVPLLGIFNVYNALAACCVGMAHGISLATCAKALGKMNGMPGRMDVVMENPFVVIVDYAVTLKAMENLYGAVKRLFAPRQLIAVFGACGGGRDRWKRPILGEIAARYADKIILTNEDPYNEDPQRILEEIQVGIAKRNVLADAAEQVLDRRTAIRKALEYAREGDVVVISGKGSEDAIAMTGGKKIPWNEGEVIREEFGKLRR